MTDSIKDNLQKQSIWLRGLYMLILAFCYSVAEIVLFAIVIFQFLFSLFKGELNPRLQKLGQQIATYIYQIIQFLSFNSDYKSYPFGAWPKGEPTELKKVDDDDKAKDKK